MVVRRRRKVVRRRQGLSQAVHTSGRHSLSAWPWQAASGSSHRAMCPTRRKGRAATGRRRRAPPSGGAGGTRRVCSASSQPLRLPGNERVHGHRGVLAWGHQGGMVANGVHGGCQRPMQLRRQRVVRVAEVHVVVRIGLQEKLPRAAGPNAVRQPHLFLEPRRAAVWNRPAMPRVAETIYVCNV